MTVMRHRTAGTYSVVSSTLLSSESDSPGPPATPPPFNLRRWKRGVPIKLFLMLFVSFVRHWPGDGGGAARALPGVYAPVAVIELDDTCADVVGMAADGCTHMFIDIWHV